MANPFVTFFNWVVATWKTADTLGKINMVLTAVTLAVGVKGFMQARQMMAKGQDILANKTSAGGKLPVIYGTRRVGAQIIYMDVSANDSRDLYVVYALSVGECDEILGRTIELDGNSLRDSARFRDGGYIGTDKISSGSGSLNTVSQNGGGINAGAGQFGSNPASRYRYVMNLHHGAATQTADPMLVASMPNWTTAHKLNGVAYIAAHYGYDKEGIWKGVPQLTVQVRGKKVFDPRDSGQTFGTVSTYKYSDNPALTFLDYITNNEYGKGLTQSQINMTTFSSAANVCDTQVDQPYFNGTAKPITWSGNAGDDFITIGGTTASESWWQNKVGELIDLYDSNGNGVIDGKEIVAIRRDNFYDGNEELIVYINQTLGSSYPTQTGTSLVKVKRFHCNGYLDANKNVMDNAKELLANMRGIFLYIDGKYELSIEDTGTSTFSITDNHIIADAGISVDYGNKDKKANKVIVEFFNANKKYELDTATVLHDANPEYYSDDGDEILEIKAEFPYISDPYIAYNMGKAILTRSRNQTTMQFLGTPEMYKLNVGDIVDLTYAGLGFSGKICRVEALELQSNGLVAVSLIEYFDVYTWEVPPQEPVEELANLPSAYAVKAPTGLAFTDTDSSSTGRPFLSWDEPTDFPDYQYRVNVVDGSGNQVINRIVDVENCDLNFLPVDTNYVASVTSLNTLGTESNPATLTFTIGDAPAGTPDIKNEAITEDKLGDGSVTNIKVANLSAGKIDTGELNLGQESGMAVRQTKTGYTSTATGFWLGNDGGTPKFNIGTSTNYLKFDGTDLDISGEISATTGSIGGFSVGSNSLIAGTGTSRISLSTADGIHLGNNTFASAPFRVALDGSVTATNATITGALTLTNIDGVTVTYTAGSLTVGTIGASNLGNDAIFPATLRYERTNSTTAPSNSEFNTAFGRDPKNNDIVVVVRTDTNIQKAYKHNGTAFAVVNNYIDGDLIVDGTISTDQIAANAVTANEILVTNLAAISANMGSITSGSIDIGSGTFTVDTSGNMVATSATVTGAITATSGSFTGSLTSSSGTIGGFTLGTTSLVAGSGTSRVSLSTADGIHLGNNTFSSAPFRVTRSGDLTATNATITGALTLTNIDGTTVTYTGGNLGVGTIGSGNLGSSAIFPTTLRYERSNATTAPSDSEFNTAFGRNPKANDIVVVARTDTNAQVAYKHDGSSFSAVSNYIDGDLIVDGSITTDQLAVNSVEANQINVGTLSAISANMGAVTAGTINNTTNTPTAGQEPTGSQAGTAIDLASGAFTFGNVNAFLYFNTTDGLVQGGLTPFSDTVSIYYQGSTAPASPSDSSMTYASTGAFSFTTNAPTGWTLGIPNTTDNIYVVQANIGRVGAGTANASWGAVSLLRAATVTETSLATSPAAISFAYASPSATSPQSYSNSYTVTASGAYSHSVGITATVESGTWTSLDASSITVSEVSGDTGQFTISSITHQSNFEEKTWSWTVTHTLSGSTVSQSTLSINPLL